MLRKLTVEDVKEHWAKVSILLPIDVWETLSSCNLTRWLLFLPCPSATPDRHGQNHKSNPASLSSHRSANILQIQEVSEYKSTDNLRDPVQSVVQSTSAGVEVCTVHSVELVGVEPVGGEEHWEEENDVAVGADGVPETEELGLPGWVLHKDDFRTILTNDLSGINQEKSEGGSKDHQHDESNVCAVSHRTLLLNINVLAEWNERSDDSSHVEDHPEPREPS